MPEYLAPGVFIEEIERGPRPIEGVATSTAAVLGETERGSTRPKLVTSFNAYRRYFGSVFAEGKYMPYALSGFFDNGGRRAYVCRIAGPGAIAASRDVGGLRIEAIGPGAWGNRIFVKIVPSSMRSGPNKDPVGFRLQVAYWQTAAPNDDYPDPFDPAQSRRLPRPTQTEDFDNLVFNDALSPDFFEKRLEDNLALVKVTLAAPGPLGARPDGAFAALAGGGDGAAPTVVEFKGENADSNLRTGLSALELDEYREVALVTAPAASDDVIVAVRTHCENSKFRFAVIDCPSDRSDPNGLDPRTDFWDIDFPAPHKGEEALARLLMECSFCQRREVVYLNELQLKSFEIRKCVARVCKHCDSPSIWIESQSEVRDPEAGASASTVDERVLPRRNRTRIKARILACIRHRGFQEEIAVCEDLSKGGLSFRSRNQYPEGTRVEVAVPFTPGTGAIFVPIRIVFSQSIPTAGLHRHGAAYIKPPLDA